MHCRHTLAAQFWQLEQARGGAAVETNKVEAIVAVVVVVVKVVLVVVDVVGKAELLAIE